MTPCIVFVAQSGEDTYYAARLLNIMVHYIIIMVAKQKNNYLLSGSPQTSPVNYQNFTSLQYFIDSNLNIPIKN